VTGYASRVPRRASLASFDEATDDEIVVACLDGNERAWDALIDRYGGYIYAVAQRAFRLDDLAASEVFQDVCVRVYDGLGKYSGKGELRSWIRAVTLSACREYFRQASRRKDPVVEPDPGPDVEAVETSLDVRRLLRALGDPCRTTLELYFFADLTQADVAKRLKVAPGTIAARLSRCVGRLRAALQEERGRPASRG
jgi:RNA polymerase sigma-70 factor, ECF subfamily